MMLNANANKVDATKTRNGNFTVQASHEDATAAAFLPAAEK